MHNIIRQLKNNISELIQEQKEKFGIKLMSIGANMYFTKDNNLSHNNTVLKNAINNDTLIGSFADSGGHIHGDISPMNRYDTQSIINVLRHRQLFDHNVETSSTDIVSGYKDTWKY